MGGKLDTIFSQLSDWNPAAPPQGENFDRCMSFMNMPLWYTAVKNDNFQMKICLSFLLSAVNIDC